MTNEQLHQAFGSYKKPTEFTIHKYAMICAKTFELAKLINELCPECGEKNSALTDLQKCRFGANAAIAIHTKEETTDESPDEMAAKTNGG